jgi:hypothetical protein
MFFPLMNLPLDWAAEQANWEAALSFLARQIENAGILVFINGIVGNSTRRKLDPDEFRGFVVNDVIVPLIFVNGADTKGAQMFYAGARAGPYLDRRKRTGEFAGHGPWQSRGRHSCPLTGSTTGFHTRR